MSAIGRLFTDVNARRAISHGIGERFGFRFDQLARVACIDEWKAYLATLPLQQMSALEISPGTVSHWRNAGFGSYTAVQFPDFDLTKDVLPQRFDIIFADHVFEHLRYPYQGAKNVLAMLAPGGVFLLTTPFLIRIHAVPRDYTRWTPSGLKAFLEDCGFDAEARGWGNRKAIVANFARWRKYGWGWHAGRGNEANFPVVVWAYARAQGTALPGRLPAAPAAS